MGARLAICIPIVMLSVAVGCGSKEDQQKAFCKVGGAAFGAAVTKVSHSENTGALSAMLAEAGCNTQVQQLNADPNAVVSFSVQPVAGGADAAPVRVSVKSLTEQLNATTPDPAVADFETWLRCYDAHPESEQLAEWCRQGLIS